MTSTCQRIAKTSVIYILTSGSPVFIYLIHHWFELKLKYFVLALVLAQLIGGALIINDLFNIKKSINESNKGLNEKRKQLQLQQDKKLTISKKDETEKKENNKSQDLIGNCIFSIVMTIVLVSQLVSVADGIISFLYFGEGSYITKKQFTIALFVCFLAGLVIPVTYEYYCGVSNDIRTTLSDVQSEIIVSFDKEKEA